MTQAPSMGLLKPFDIFLSYKSEDFAWVSQLRTDLQKRGAKVWLDHSEIRPGDLFAAALEDGLESSQTVGLVVTPESLASGWVREEYYRALSLTKQKGLLLIPLILRDAELPGFLSGRHYIDFRDIATYEQSVDRILWPGITGRKVRWIGVHGVGGWAWPQLGSILRRRGIDISGCDYVETAPAEVSSALKSGYRVVVLTDVFEGWPENKRGFRPPSEYVENIFAIRQETKGGRDEVVFVLYQNPDALDKAPHALDARTVERLRHYFLIPRLFDDGLRGGGPDTKMLDELELKFSEVWLKAQRELLKSERSTSTL